MVGYPVFELHIVAVDVDLSYFISSFPNSRRLSNTKKSGTEPLNISAPKTGGFKSAFSSAPVMNKTEIPQNETISPVETVAASPKYKGVVKLIFLTVNMGLMVMMSATGVLGIMGSSSVADVSTVIVGLYMILFAGILAIFELIQIYPCSAVDFVYKKNFGFLYGLMGKSGFTIFMAVLSFGITNPQQLAVATGKNSIYYFPTFFLIYLPVYYHIIFICFFYLLFILLNKILEILNIDYNVFRHYYYSYYITYIMKFLQCSNKKKLEKRLLN